MLASTAYIAEPGGNVSSWNFKFLKQIMELTRGGPCFPNLRILARLWQR